MFFINNRIPQEILGTNKENDVNILIGENGSGKSTLLAEISEYFLSNKFQVIAIANSIHDKFVNYPKLHLLRGRGGRKQIKEIIKKAFKNIHNNDPIRLKNLTRAIEYVGYSPMIGIKVNGIDVEIVDRLSQSLNLKINIYDLQSLMTKIFYEQENQEIIWIRFDDLSFFEVDKASIIQIFNFEKILVEHKIIRDIEIYLMKGTMQIPLLSASSGELSLISSIIYLSTTINNGSVILIDEPENSLHPSWQRHYVKNLMDIFYYYQPKFIIATHSPLIVSDSEISVEGTQIFKSKNYEFILERQDRVNIEEVFYKFFDTVTPQNRFLSNYLVGKLNKLSIGSITINEINSIVEKIKSNSFDERQKGLSDGILEIAEKIISNGKG